MKLETLPVKDLQFHPGNTRQHEETDIAAIARSLKEFGQQKPIVVDERNVVIAGNGTLAAAQALEWETLQAVRTTLDERNKLAFSIADNRTAELSEWDYPILKDALVELDTGDFDLTVTGWSKKEIGQLLTTVGEPKEPESTSTELIECPKCGHEFIP